MSYTIEQISRYLFYVCSYNYLYSVGVFADIIEYMV